MALATALSNVAGVLIRLERWDEVDAAIEAGLQADGRHGMLHLLRAQRLLGRGLQTDALKALQRFLDDRRILGREKTLLFFTQDPHFDVMRQDPQFQRLLLRAAAA